MTVVSRRSRGSELVGAVPEPSERQPSQPAPPRRRVHAHPLELGDRVGDVAEGACRDHAPVAHANQGLAAAVQIGGRDRLEVIVPPTTTTVDSSLRERHCMKLADGAGVRGNQAPQLEHAARGLIRTMRASKRGAAGDLAYLTVAVGSSR